MEFNSTGLLKLVFSKEIHPPRLRVTDPSPPQNRTLESTKPVQEYNITEVVQLIVEDVHLDNVDGDEKQIADYHLTKVTDDTLYIQVDFRNPKTISTD